MSTVRDLVRQKGGEIFSVAPGASAFEALKLMAQHNTGALLVLEGGKVSGIVSERDCVRKLELLGRSARETAVSAIMTSKVITVDAGQSLEDCMSLMLESNIRHLPVYEGKDLLGLISVRDVLKTMIEVQKVMLAQLERYITGGGR
jgi:CBS domain-containing protein